MILVTFVVVSSIAFIPEVGCVKETLEGITPVVVIVLLDQPDDLSGGCGPGVNDHVGWVDRKDFDLVSRECLLKLLQFGNTSTAFGGAG